MARFHYAHASHPRWEEALARVVEQLCAQIDAADRTHSASLGLLYLTDHLAAHAQDILQGLSAELPLVTDWAGTVGVGICATNAEYFDVPAIAVMLLDLPADQYRVFSGVAPLGSAFVANTALVHADGATPDIGDLVREMAQRTESGFLFGGLSSSRAEALQFAVAADGAISGQGAASGVFSGGLSGVAFARDVQVVSRVTQGCAPISQQHVITACDGNLILELDHQPALSILLADLGISLEQPQRALDVLRATLLGLTDAQGTLVHQTGNFGNQVMVRHLIGLDPARAGVAVASNVECGMRVAFCQRNVQAARADLVRICAEIREEIESEDRSMLAADAVHLVDSPRGEERHIAGAIYVSCTGRGGPHFGAPDAELQLVRRSLGDVPLAGFFAAGEIGYDRLYGYTGVLTVFLR